VFLGSIDSRAEGEQLLPGAWRLAACLADGLLDLPLQCAVLFFNEVYLFSVIV
jgi:hypothetical protein